MVGGLEMRLSKMTNYPLKRNRVEKTFHTSKNTNPEIVNLNPVIPFFFLLHNFILRPSLISL